VVRGVRKREISTDDLAFAYYLMGKELVREKREKDAAEKAKRVGRKRGAEGRS